MPNWCENRVLIQADNKKDFKEFRGKAFKRRLNNKLLDKEMFQFNNLIPRPEEEDGNWYNWNINNWGVKWDINFDNECIIDIDDTYVEMEFQTAWGPPHLIYAYIVRNFPKVDVSWFYHEPGMELAGYFDPEDIISERCSKCNTDEDVHECIMCDIRLCINCDENEMPLSSKEDDPHTYCTPCLKIEENKNIK